MESIIATLMFVTVVLFLSGLYLIVHGKKKVVKTRLKNYSEIHKTAYLEIEEKEMSKVSTKNMLRVFGKFFATASITKKIEQRLLKAEIPMRGEEFLALNIIGVVLSLLIGITFFGGIGPALVLSGICIVIPQVLIKKKRKARVEKINQQIGDCLTVMANSLRAGYSFQQAIDLVGKEMHGPLANEFRKTNREINLGITIDDALINLTKRAESDDLELLITAVLIQRQIGGNLAEILDNISETIRERIRMKGEIKTLTAQGRISGLIIGLMPPILFFLLLLINPSYMSVMVKSKIGWIILLGGLTSEIIGVLLIKRVIDIEV